MRVSLFLLALAGLLGLSAAQLPFTQYNPSTDMWSPRDQSSVELVKKTNSAFTDGNTLTSVRLSNYILLYGGVSGSGPQNDVWVTVNGRQWYWIAGTSDGNPHPFDRERYAETFPAVYDAFSCQDTNYRQYRAGGQVGGNIFNDVYSSVDSGLTWQLKTEFAQWEPRYFASMVSDASNNLYIAGGILELQGEVTPNGRRPRRSSGQVWMSAARYQGSSWTPMNRFDDAFDAPNDGPTRRAVAMLLSQGPNQLTWLTGVNTGYAEVDNDPYESYMQDAWASKDGGRTWGLVNSNVSYGRRDDANAEITEGGLIVLAGGYAGTKTQERYNDVWLSANGGYTWGLCQKESAWDDRRYQMTLLDDAGYLWVMGGQDAYGQRLGDVWRSTASFNNVADITSRCKVTVPSCGTGLQCFPGAGTLVSADGSGAYCDACPFTFSSQASRVTTLTAFLIIFVILFVLAFAALGYTFYKLRAAGSSSPIPLPAIAQRWWTKDAANGGASGSTDSAATTNGDGLYQPLRIRDQV